MANAHSQFGSTTAAPLRSEFADDSDMLELIEYFIGELDDRTQALSIAFDQGDLTQIRTIAHQLKGAAGGYGFPSISESAAALESALKAGESEVSALQEKFEALIQLCQRAAV